MKDRIFMWLGGFLMVVGLGYAISSLLTAHQSLDASRMVYRDAMTSIYSGPIELEEINTGIHLLSDASGTLQQNLLHVRAGHCVFLFGLALAVFGNCFRSACSPLLRMVVVLFVGLGVGYTLRPDLSISGPEVMPGVLERPNVDWEDVAFMIDLKLPAIQRFDIANFTLSEEAMVREPFYLLLRSGYVEDIYGGGRVQISELNDSGSVLNRWLEIVSSRPESEFLVIVQMDGATDEDLRVLRDHLELYPSIDWATTRFEGSISFTPRRLVLQSLARSLEPNSGASGLEFIELEP